MKKNYSAPKMEIVELKKENMILTSGICKDLKPCMDEAPCRPLCEGYGCRFLECLVAK